MAVAAETVVGSHVLTIDGYSKTMAALAVRQSIQSDTFHVAGYGWYIKCFPRGDDEESADWVSVFLELDIDHHGGLSHEMKPSYEFVLLDRAGEAILRHGWHGSWHEQRTTYSTADGFPSAWGTSEFIQRKTLESYLIVQDDECCRIRCDVAIVREPPALPPPPGLGDLLLASEVGRDVTFLVGGEQFTAHTCVLAARSSSTVFMEEVLGTAKEKESAVVVVDGMAPRLFKALLRFLYTDSLPDDELAADHGDDRIAVLLGLLAAADRYDMARLKLICSDLLLATESGRDVTFVVGDGLFTAHSCVLAARSSTAFMAKVLGTGKESGGSRHVLLGGISQRAFTALLHFIYTDSVADHGIARDLLKEADRYGMERLKMTRTDVLCSNINATTALDTLPLSHKHGCLKLNQACVKFITGMLDAFNLEQTK